MRSKAMLLACLLCFSCAGAWADEGTQQFGPITGGISGSIDKDGALSLSVGDVLSLENGRSVQRIDGKWRVTAKEIDSEGAQVVKAIDFALSPKNYVGQKVRVVGGRMFGAQVNYGILNIPGSSLHVVFSELPRDQVKAFVENCSSIMTDADCFYDFVGTVERRDSDVQLLATSASLSPRQAKRPKR